MVPVAKTDYGFIVRNLIYFVGNFSTTSVHNMCLLASFAIWRTSSRHDKHEKLNSIDILSAFKIKCNILQLRSRWRM